MNNPTVKRKNGTTSIEAIVENKDGIHARPAALICGEANKYAPRIITLQAAKSKLTFECNSILGIMTGLPYYKDKVIISTEGEDEIAEKACLGIYRIIMATEEELRLIQAQQKELKLQASSDYKPQTSEYTP